MSDTLQDVRLAEALVALSHHVSHLFTEVGRNHRLSQQQVRLLCAVVRNERVCMGELGRQTQLEKSNLSNLVDRLEQRGLAVRTRDTDDRRLTWVALTEEGTALAHLTHAEVTARVNELVAKLSGADQGLLADVVHRLVAEA
jgi:DNA-binding MarR family transcriptional regulator